MFLYDWYFVQDFYNDSECDELLDICKNNKSRLLHDSPGPGKKVDTTVIEMEKFDDKLDRLFRMVHDINKNFFAINRHPKLQWLCATAVSPNLGRQDHTWIKVKSKEKGSNDTKKTLMQLFPAMKASDIEVLSQLVDKKELREHLRDHGNTDKD